MKTLTTMSKSVLMLTVFGLITVIMTGSAPSVSTSNFSVDEDIYVTANVVAQPNTVAISISRTGPEAGMYPGCVVYTVRFNEGWGSIYEQDITYRQTLMTYETSYSGFVAGPIPSIDAQVIDVRMEYDNPECHEW